MTQLVFWGEHSRPGCGAVRPRVELKRVNISRRGKLIRAQKMGRAARPAGSGMGAFPISKKVLEKGITNGPSTPRQSCH